MATKLYSHALPRALPQSLRNSSKAVPRARGGWAEPLARNQLGLALKLLVLPLPASLGGPARSAGSPGRRRVLLAGGLPLSRKVRLGQRRRLSRRNFGPLVLPLCWGRVSGNPPSLSPVGLDVVNPMVIAGIGYRAQLGERVLDGTWRRSAPS